MIKEKDKSSAKRPALVELLRTIQFDNANYCL